MEIITGTLKRISSRERHHNNVHCVYLEEDPSIYYVTRESLELINIGDYMEISLIDERSLNPRNDLDVEGQIGGYIKSLRVYKNKSATRLSNFHL